MKYGSENPNEEIKQPLHCKRYNGTEGFGSGTPQACDVHR